MFSALRRLSSPFLARSSVQISNNTRPFRANRHLLELPNETLVDQIFTYLDVYDIYRLRRVCAYPVARWYNSDIVLIRSANTSTT